MDIKSAFLNGDLVEEVYVQQPSVFINSSNERKVFSLHKSLYGLHQAPRAWNAKLNTSLVSLGFTRSLLEHAVYHRDNDHSFLLVDVYVDNLIITGINPQDIIEFKIQMKSKFKMSDLGILSYYLVIEVHQENGEITLCQGAYAAKVLELAGMIVCNPCHTPMENRLKLSKKDGGARKMEVQRWMQLFTGA